MAILNIKIPKSVKRNISSIPLPWRIRIGKAIDLLRQEPYFGYPLSGRHKGKRRVKVWPYRIVYMIDPPNKRVVITEVKHRGSVSYD